MIERRIGCRSAVWMVMGSRKGVRELMLKVLVVDETPS